MSKRIQYYLLHIIGCLLFISIPILSSPDFHYSLKVFSVPPFQRNFLDYVLLLAFFYYNYLYLIPQFYFEKKKFIFYLSVFFCYIIIVFLPSLIIPDGAGMNMPGPPPGMPPGNGGFGSGGQDMAMIHWLEGSSVFQFLLVFFLSLLLKINNHLADIQNEKLKTEVSYLKAQINPHFLFNTLNSLYSLTLAKSDDAPQAILKLSGMMRYVVTESTRDYVSLEKETDYIKNYIDLQQLRMDESTKLVFTITGDVAGKNISPLLLIPFIENAFKYGLNPDGESVIIVKLIITDTELLLNVINDKFGIEVPDNLKSEQGMENTRLRLQYLYPKKHQLLIFDTAESFEVKLTIQLV